VRIGYGRVIKLTVIDHEAIFTGAFLGDREGGGIPRSLPGFKLALADIVVHQFYKGLASFPLQVERPLLDGVCSWFELYGCLPVRATHRAFPYGFWRKYGICIFGQQFLTYRLYMLPFHLFARHYDIPYHGLRFPHPMVGNEVYGHIFNAFGVGVCAFVHVIKPWQRTHLHGG
jgi:hypothetical protein